MSDICNNRPLKPLNGSILCPNCGERLTPADLEVYAKCPFCDWSFPRDAGFDRKPLDGAGSQSVPA